MLSQVGVGFSCPRVSSIYRFHFQSLVLFRHHEIHNGLTVSLVARHEHWTYISNEICTSLCPLTDRIDLHSTSCPCVRTARSQAYKCAWLTFTWTAFEHEDPNSISFHSIRGRLLPRRCSHISSTPTRTSGRREGQAGNPRTQVHGATQKGGNCRFTTNITDLVVTFSFHVGMVRLSPFKEKAGERKGRKRKEGQGTKRASKAPEGQ